MKCLTVACLLIIGISFIDCKQKKHRASAAAHNAAEQEHSAQVPATQGAGVPSKFHPEQQSPPAQQAPQETPSPSQGTGPPPSQAPPVSPPPAANNQPGAPPTPECNQDEDCSAKDQSKPFCVNGFCAATKSGKKKKNSKLSASFYEPQDPPASESSPEAQNPGASQNSPTNAPSTAATQGMSPSPGQSSTNGRKACKSNDDCKNTNTPHCVEGYCSATPNGKKNLKKKLSGKKHGGKKAIRVKKVDSED